MPNTFDEESYRERIANLPDATLEVKGEWLPSVLDGDDCEIPCKPKEHAEHDVLCSEDYDAHFCFTCDTWIEAQCDNKKCQFCKNRPEKMVKDETGS